MQGMTGVAMKNQDGYSSPSTVVPADKVSFGVAPRGKSFPRGQRLKDGTIGGLRIVDERSLEEVTDKHDPAQKNQQENGKTRRHFRQ